MAGFSLMMVLFTFVSVIAGILLAVIVCICVKWLIRSIAYYMLFQKAGETPWTAFLPIMNIYKVYKISVGKRWFFAWMIGHLILAALLIVEENLYNSPLYTVRHYDIYLSVMGFVCFVLLCFLLLLNILQKISLAKMFSVSAGFTVGLIFFPDIFLIILGANHNYIYRKKLNRS